LLLDTLTTCIVTAIAFRFAQGKIPDFPITAPCNGSAHPNRVGAQAQDKGAQQTLWKILAYDIIFALHRQSEREG